VRQDVDADADRADLARHLEHTRCDAGFVQRKREREATDAGADDDDFHADGSVVGASILALADARGRTPRRAGAAGAIVR
jgi:hypothetical protein